jgi:hypothetical protein
MFITHFTGTAYCNEFSLASDDPNGHPFNDVFVEQYRLGRCKLTKVHTSMLLSIGHLIDFSEAFSAAIVGLYEGRIVVARPAL